MTTAIEVAEMEMDIKTLREENLKLCVELGKSNTERELLRMEVVLANEAARGELVRSTSMETILKQVSAGLVDGLKVMEQRRTDDATRARLRTQEPEDRRPQFLKDRDPNPDAPVSRTAPLDERITRGVLADAAATVMTRPARELTRFAAMQPRRLDGAEDRGEPNYKDIPANTFPGSEVNVEAEMAELINTIKHNG